jgi:adenylate kinase
MIAQFVIAHSEWMHIVASDVIRAATNEAKETLRTASQGKIEANQDLLVQGIDRIKETNIGGRIILDAHSVIDNDRAYVRIPLSVIADLRADSIICVLDEPENILKRRLADPARNRPRRSAFELAEYQHAALEAAQDFSTRLKIPMHSVNANDSNRFSNLICNT